MRTIHIAAVAPACGRYLGMGLTVRTTFAQEVSIMKPLSLRRLSVSTALGMALTVPAWVCAQPPAAKPANPTPGCHATPAQLAANKKVAMDFFITQGAERVALAAPTYKQHNPAFKKRAEQAGETDYQEYAKFFAQPRTPPRQQGPQPPRGNPFEVVTAECDIVTIVHKVYRQDPTAAPGTFYEAFTFDTFRVKDGKLTEHWDGAQIQPVAARAPGGG
jgi:predicted SnoaL-like aldol condensation-catalyzing enzyme